MRTGLQCYIYRSATGQLFCFLQRIDLGMRLPCLMMIAFAYNFSISTDDNCTYHRIGAGITFSQTG